MRLTDVIGPIAIGLVVYLANLMWKRFSAAVAAQPASQTPPAPNIATPGATGALLAAATGSPTMPRPRKRLVERPSPPPVAQSAGAAARASAPMPPAFAAEAADAFPVLDLSLPGADGPAIFRTARRPSPIFRGVAPGSRAWGVQAIVAMEVLGPPVSLRSGATLGAPHAF